MTRSLWIAMLASAFSGAALAAEINVLGSVAVKEAYLELRPQFEAASGHKVVTTWAGTTDMLKRMRGGESFDLIIIAASSLDELAREGRVVPGSRVDIAKSGVGVAVRAGAPKPDLGSADSLKRTLLSAKTIGISSGPSGVYLTGLFQRMGIADELKPKLRTPPSGAPVAELVARGEADIGFQQVSEIVHVRGVDFAGPLPADIQRMTVFSGGVPAASKQPEAARAWMSFLASAQALPVLARHGLESGNPPAEVMNIAREGDIKFIPSPLTPGAAQAIISGDPKIPGQPYVVRNRFSPGTFSPPHFHPETRYIQVIKGTWWLGYGTKWDKELATPVPAGSFVVHHPNKIHWDGAKDEEVIVQIMGVGPGTSTRVDESGQSKK